MSRIEPATCDSEPGSPDFSVSKKFNMGSPSKSVMSTGGGNMKVRLGQLEDAFDFQNQKNEDIDSRVERLQKDLDESNERFVRMMQENKEKMEEAMNALRKEFAHKFELQMAENQRTQQHIASLKTDRSALVKKLNYTVERLRIVELEVTGEDGGNEDFGLTNSSSYNNLSGSPPGTR